MAKKKFVMPKIERVEKGAEPQELKDGGNTGLPFGLCKKYGIPIGKDWTPRDAWDALYGRTGKSPEEIYNELEDSEKQKTEEKPNEVVDASKKLGENNESGEQSEEDNPYSEEAKKYEGTSTEQAINNLLDNLVDYQKRGFTERRMVELISGGNEDFQKSTTYLIGEVGTRFHNSGAGAKYGYHNKGSFYRTTTNTISLDNSYFLNYEDKVGLLQKGQGFYHECWHSIDHNCYYGDESLSRYDPVGRYQNRKYISTSYKLPSGKTFSEIYDEELTPAKADEIVEYINNYEPNRDNVKRFMDMIDCLQSVGRTALMNTGSEKYGGGHAKGYFGDKDKKAQEAFAEIASATATNKLSRETFEKFLPNTTKAFDAIYDELKKGRRKFK